MHMIEWHTAAWINCALGCVSSEGVPDSDGEAVRSPCDCVWWPVCHAPQYSVSQSILSISKPATSDQTNHSKALKYIIPQYILTKLRAVLSRPGSLQSFMSQNLNLTSANTVTNHPIALKCTAWQCSFELEKELNFAVWEFTFWVISNALNRFEQLKSKKMMLFDSKPSSYSIEKSAHW